MPDFPTGDLICLSFNNPWDTPLPLSPLIVIPMHSGGQQVAGGNQIKDATHKREALKDP